MKLFPIITLRYCRPIPLESEYAQALMTDSSHILVVDDHSDIRELLGRHLRQHEFRVSLAADAVQARAILAGEAIDLVVLDVMMPGEDGISLCRHIRDSLRLPVILLTALTEETDRVIGLEVGADDYVTKPFSPRELLARIKAVLRRTHEMPPQRSISARYLRFGHWLLDTDARELQDEAGVAVPLSSSEFKLLSIFLQHPRHVFQRDQLLELAQGREAKPFDRSVDNLISRLRRKVERDPKQPELVATIRGGGYCLACDVTEVAA